MIETTLSRGDSCEPEKMQAAKGISATEIRSLLGEERYDECHRAVEQVVAAVQYEEIKREAEEPRKQCLDGAKWDQGAPGRTAAIRCLLAALYVAAPCIVWYQVGFIQAVATLVALLAISLSLLDHAHSARKASQGKASGVETVVRNIYESSGLLATVEACAACPESHDLLAELIGRHGGTDWALLSLHLAMRKDDNGVRDFIISNRGVAAFLRVAGRARKRLVHDAVVAHAPRLPKEFSLHILGGLANRASLPILLWGLDTRLRLPACLSVIRGLGQMGAPATVGKLEQFVVKHSPIKKPSAGVSGAEGPKRWREAMHALETIGSPKALEIVETEKWHRSDASDFFDRLIERVHADGTGSATDRIRSILAKSEFGCTECSRHYDVERTVKWLATRVLGQPGKGSGPAAASPVANNNEGGQDQSGPAAFSCHKCGSASVRYSKDCFWGVEE